MKKELLKLTIPDKPQSSKQRYVIIDIDPMPKLISGEIDVSNLDIKVNQ